MIKFNIGDSSFNTSPELDYTLRIWLKNTKLDFITSTSPLDAINKHSNKEETILLSHYFATGDFSKARLNSNGWIDLEDGNQPDYLASAFYMLNSIQEHNHPDQDELGRFKFINSYQHRLKNTQENKVQFCFDEFSKRVGIVPAKEKTKSFLTHDIDMVYGSLIEDGFNVLKKGRIDQFFQLLFNVAIGKPDWLNMDKIMKLESEYDCKSVFYWLVNKGKINSRERNSDYNFKSSKIKRQFEAVGKNEFENGLHKSISSESFQQELIKFGDSPIGNRYHYLKFNLPQAYQDIEDAGLKLDASLGFAEEGGFRNSYGLPFNPYNFKTQKAHSFVEVPLHVMDRTFFQYKKSTVQNAEKDIFAFFEKNKENCVLSVLWHNNFFSDYKFKGYLPLYKKILAYIKENKFGTLSQSEIISKYSIA